MSGAITIRIIKTAGSAPRDAGTTMQVTAEGITGTIGGGALEWQAMAWAREMLAAGQSYRCETIPLGPALGQCCGGSVTLELTTNDDATKPTGKPFWIWGAGHVGRAIAQICAPLPDFDVTLIDDDAARLPPADIDGATKVIAADLPILFRHAPADADHLILTYSHEIDLALCHGALTHGFASCGLIGSATKWARFRSRLASLGHASEQIARIDCPIGDPALGKHPHAIAVGVASALLKARGDSAKGGR